MKHTFFIYMYYLFLIFILSFSNFSKRLSVHVHKIFNGGLCRDIVVVRHGEVMTGNSASVVGLQIGVIIGDIGPFVDSQEATGGVVVIVTDRRGGGRGQSGRGAGDGGSGRRAQNTRRSASSTHCQRTVLLCQAGGEGRGQFPRLTFARTAVERLRLRRGCCSCSCS